MIDEFSPFPLADQHDHEILMHRDVHFSGSFPLMIDYYLAEGKGTYPDFEISRIKHMHQVEEKSGQNLSEIFLESEEKDEVERARKKYQELKELYTTHASSEAKLIADLILTESVEAEREIQAVCAQGKTVVPSLIALLEQIDFYNPLFPGYGQAPAYAAICLGKIKDTRAIAPLFEALGRADFFTEEAILDALKSFGDSAKFFLLKALKNEPFSKDNENAAIALLAMELNEEISSEFLSVLANPLSHTRDSFTIYLILGCQYLRCEESRKHFISITSALTSDDAKQEAALIQKHWRG